MSTCAECVYGRPTQIPGQLLCFGQPPTTDGVVALVDTDATSRLGASAIRPLVLESDPGCGYWLSTDQYNAEECELMLDIARELNEHGLRDAALLILDIAATRGVDPMRIKQQHDRIVDKQ